jgi:hypothetical protein
MIAQLFALQINQILLKILGIGRRVLPLISSNGVDNHENR